MLLLTQQRTSHVVPFWLALSIVQGYNAWLYGERIHRFQARYINRYRPRWDPMFYYDSSLPGSHLRHSDLPFVDDCSSTSLDLLLVADGSGKLKDSLRKQMEFFSKFLEIFNSGRIDDFTRVNVSLVLSCSGTKGTASLKVKINFGDFSNLTALRRAFELDNDSDPDSLNCQTSSIGEVHDESLNHLSKSTSLTRNIVVVVVLLNSYGQLYQESSSSVVEDLEATSSIRILTVILMETHNRYLSQSVHKLLSRVRGTVAVSLLEDLSIDQGIPMVVCHKCYPGWFWDASIKQGRPLLAFSCYKILPEKNGHWIGANKMCIEQGSSLVSIEATEEKRFLDNKLSEHIICPLGNKGKACYESKRFFIGLSLSNEIYHYRTEYRWLNGLPLVYSLWGEEDLRGGGNGSCVMYSPASPRPTFHWKSIGCGAEVSSIAVCEATAKYVLEQQNVDVACVVSEKKRERALRRGEVAFNISGGHDLERDVLISVSDSLSDMGSKGQDIWFFLRLDGQYEKMKISSSDVKRFQCSHSGHFIPYSKVCDGLPDCVNYDDEQFCKHWELHLPPAYPRNEGTSCGLFLDDYPRGGEEQRLGTCTDLVCPGGESFPKHWFLDGRQDCSTCRKDTYVELAIAASHGVTDCVFTCNRTDCVTRAMLGDGVIQCTGPEGPLDETVGALESSTCYGENDTSGFTNWGPRCVYVKDPTGGVLGCQNFQHLQGCENFTCPEGYVKCPNSYCIPVHYVFDSEPNCPLGEDETKMDVHHRHLFKCPYSNVFLHPDRVCDNKKDCRLGEDERNCDVSCRQGFLCVAGTVVRSDYNMSEPLTDLSFVDRRTRYLDVSGIDLSAGVSSLGCRVSQLLVYLNMSSCSIMDPDFKICSLGTLTNVLTLDISGNALNNAHLNVIMSLLSEIQYLNVSRNPYISVTRIPPNLIHLKEIDLSFTKVHTLEILPVLRLIHLNLRGTNVSNLRPGLCPKGTSIGTLDLRSIPLVVYSLGSFSGVTITTLLADTYKLCCPQLQRPLKSCQAPVDPFSTCSDLIGGLYMRVLVWVIGVTAFLGNLGVFTSRLLHDRSSLRMECGHFVANLNIADLLMGLYLLIIASADVYYRNVYFMHEDGWKYGPVCKLAGFLSTLSSVMSMFFVSLITLDRFLVMKFPFCKYRISDRYVHVICGVVWLLGLSIAMLPLLPPFQHWKAYNFDGVCLSLPLGDRSIPGFQFSLAVFVFLNLFLFLLVAVGQLVTYRALVEVSKSVDNQTMRRAQRRAERRAQDVEISRRLFLVAATDFACWFPVGIMGLISMAGHPLGYQIYAWSTVLLVPINSAVNPVLYNLVNIKNIVKSVIRKHLK